MFQIINNINDLKKIKEQLNLVYQNHKSLSFYSPDYIINSFELFLEKNKNNQLYFVIIKEKTTIINYIPWYIDSKKTLRFIFDKHTDYCGIIGAIIDNKKFNKVFRNILKNKVFKKIELNNLMPNDPLLNYFKSTLGSGVFIAANNNHCYLNFSNNRHYFDTLNSKERNNLNKINSLDLDFKVINNNSLFPMKEIFYLNQKMKNDNLRTAKFFNENFYKLTEKLFISGDLELAVTYNKDSICSISFVLINQATNSRMIWISMYENSIKNVLLKSYFDYIKYLHQPQNTTLSLGRGAYDYKLNNFQPLVENLYNIRYSNSKYDFFFSNYFGLKQFIKRFF